MRLRIVKRIVVAVLLCVAGDGVGDGAGSALPIVGISPAKAETDRTHVRINAIPSLFIGVFSCFFEKLPVTGIGRYQILVLASKPARKDSLQGSGIEHYYPARSSQTYPPNPLERL